MHSTLAVPRNYLNVPANKVPCLVTYVVMWYSAVKGAFVDATALYEGLCHVIEGFITYRYLQILTEDFWKRLFSL